MYAKCVFWKVFKKHYKTIKESISKNFADFVLTGRALIKGQSRYTQRALEHSKDTSRAPEHSIHFRHSKGTRALKALVQLEIWGTQAFDGHLGTQSTWILEHSTLGTEACNLIKKRLQHRRFPVNTAKFLSTRILKIICEQLLLENEVSPTIICNFLFFTSYFSFPCKFRQNYT